MSNAEVVIDQFLRQAIPFAEKPEHTLAEASRVVLERLALRQTDRLLDVACGPGLTACEFAPLIEHVTGVDLTPAMIEQAKKQASGKGIQNICWRVSDVTALPFDDGAFTVVFSRYAFHHFPDPAKVLAEMARVCAPGGRVVVADVYSTSRMQQELYDRIERLRDPSHASALELDRFRQLFVEVGLKRGPESLYPVGMELDALLASSFPNPGDAERVRSLLREDVAKNMSGFQPHEVDGQLRISFPIVVLTGLKGGRPVL